MPDSPISHGVTRQDYGSPWAFIKAVESRFGPLTFDLAASHENAKCERFFTKEDDALSLRPWPMGLLWLNPPFKKIEPWAERCLAEASEPGKRILMLTPASIDSNWFAEHVHQKALVLAVNPRIVFEGETSGYPKPLMLSCFGYPPGFDVWRWKK